MTKKKAEVITCRAKLGCSNEGVGEATLASGMTQVCSKSWSAAVVEAMSSTVRVCSNVVIVICSIVRISRGKSLGGLELGGIILLLFNCGDRVYYRVQLFV